MATLPLSKANRIQLFSLKSPQMWAFHLPWMAFFVCFFAWFACSPLRDRFGPRKTYTSLLLLGALPVFGAVWASFVITQYHTSVRFAPNVVGTANTATAGWGNAGETQQTLSVLGVLVTVSALCAIVVRFSTTTDHSDNSILVAGKLSA